MSDFESFRKSHSTKFGISETLGSFFVYSRLAEPFHSIFINNRLNTNSLVEPITKQIELQSQPPFLLYRNQRSAISGFWFYSKEDCVRIHLLLEKLIKNCNNGRPDDDRSGNHLQQAVQQQQVFAKPQNGNGRPMKQDGVDIFSMLSKAQENFNNSTCSAADVGPTPQQLNQKFAAWQMNGSPPHHQHQPLMKQLSNAMPDITSPNVVNFFAAAQQPNGAGPVIGDGPHIQSQNNQFMAKHPNIPPVQTLDEIEKQHRVSSSPPQKVGKYFERSTCELVAYSVSYISEPKMIKTDFNNLLNSVAKQQQHPSVSPQPIKLQQPGAFQSQVSNKPTLITPAMFQATNVVEEKIAAPAPSQSNIRPEPLTQNQLLQALNYMLESDPEFIRKIHEAYVKSFNKMVSL